VYQLDLTTWPRCDAECSPSRGYYYHPSRYSAGQPIVAGWAFQWIAQLCFERDSWTDPAAQPRGSPQGTPARHHPVREVEAPKSRLNPEQVFGYQRRRTLTPEEFGDLLAGCRPFYRDHFLI
jgi:hypothetical protein